MSKAGVFTGPSGIQYRDRKRYLWVTSLFVPSLVFLGPGLYLATDNALWLWLPLAFYYLVVPVLDLLIGEDLSNPPEEVVPQLEADNYYRWITYALVPIIWGVYLFGIAFMATQPLPLHGIIAMIILLGGVCGFGINLGHELGHKKSRTERWLAKFVLAPCAYGHFFIEHNKGHHRDVATPEDPASSRMGESIWKFVWREMPGAFKRAWQLEKTRLQREGKAVWSLHNEILQPALITLVTWGALTAVFGLSILPVILAVAFWGAFQLTSANYIEHYGLRRQKDANGRYERTQPHHSWNSNHTFSNWATFHLQRHSDHHAHPARRYQSLRHFENLPSLPNGYFGMFLVSYIPPLWYAVMDKRLLAQVGTNVDNINMDPARKQALIRKYQLRQGEAA
ncbi:alkane 1-monooxygenase [Alcanivorax hongdengensis A-11-3]|uniref:Alkane 1-monooxygenase n=1 Tax=Alcanivorax hongdengensis A-11-3 TaxID=1177179 RepID=L0WGR7_9GAMM|nr:alkane 1-monooxygenase [Alcanivorax hongdengensis]EKF76058.1 alkane 1-monooxygenase [Alcanivorax hongdengensis A-11-3]